MDDIFLRIIDGSIPSAKIYEDEQVVAFLDIHPNNKGHALVVPRKKFRNIFDGDPEVLGHMMQVAKRIALAQKTALNADGVNIVMNNEPAAHQEIFHAHLHVIPRFNDDHVFTTPRHLSYEPGEIEVVAETIKNSLR